MDEHAIDLFEVHDARPEAGQPAQTTHCGKYFEAPEGRQLSVKFGFSINHPKRRTVLGPTLALVIQTGGCRIGVSQPVLHLGDVRAMFKRVGGGSCTKGMGPGCSARQFQPVPGITYDQFPNTLPEHRFGPG